MRKGKLERFTLAAIADALNGSDVATARVALSQTVNSLLDICGRVEKVAKRDKKVRLVIQPDDCSGFVVFADCPGELENLVKLRIRKGSSVGVRGKFQSFGALAVCLADCRLMQSQGNSKEKKGKFALKNEK